VAAHALTPEHSSQACPSCQASDLTSVYRQEPVPVHSCLLLPSREQAERFPRGAIRLVLCNNCGCIWNTEFDSSLTAYAGNYEDSQAFSPRFREFAHELAEELVERYGILGKRVLEIGCGKGDFLLLLCELGGNRGVGIDPAVDPAAAANAGHPEVTFIAEAYSERYADIRADLVVCRHTLEHLPNAGEFLRLIRNGAGDSPTTVVYLEVPDVERVLREGAFWDIYYEHCCYFSAGSFERLARGANLEVVDVRDGFDGQYVQLYARPSSDRSVDVPIERSDVERLREAVGRFQTLHAEQVGEWNARLERMRADGRTAALWGSGSKAVAFLTTLDARDEVECVVDINPRKQGMYMAGVRQRIVPPSSLSDTRPDVVIVMNPVYRDEIQAELNTFGLSPELLSL
jgi:SAM-dependent methyltransferase